MIVRVRLFAAVRQAAEGDSIEVELPEGATIGQVRAGLIERLPAMAELIRRAMFALDAQYARDGQVVPPDAEVACIPPVSGG